MATITNDYIAIPKNTYIKIQNQINSRDLSENEKIEFWFIPVSNLSEKQKKELNQVKNMKESEFINI